MLCAKDIVEKIQNARVTQYMRGQTSFILLISLIKTPALVHHIKTNSQPIYLIK